MYEYVHTSDVSLDNLNNYMYVKIQTISLNSNILLFQQICVVFLVNWKLGVLRNAIDIDIAWNLLSEKDYVRSSNLQFLVLYDVTGTYISSLREASNLVKECGCVYHSIITCLRNHWFSSNQYQSFFELFITNQIVAVQSCTPGIWTQSISIDSILNLKITAWAIYIYTIQARHNRCISSIITLWLLYLVHNWISIEHTSWLPISM